MQNILRRASTAFCQASWLNAALNGGGSSSFTTLGFLGDSFAAGVFGPSLEGLAATSLDLGGLFLPCPEEGFANTADRPSAALPRSKRPDFSELGGVRLS